jgi:hypothetical protein
MFLYADPSGIAKPVSKGVFFGQTAKEWVKEARMIDHEEVGEVRRWLRSFTARILANLEPRKDLKAKVDGGEWANVIPYEDHEKDYGRNFAICVGRTNVLHSTAWWKNFEGRKDFEVYENPSPTEQVFFTLYPLVRTPKGVFDVFSKKPIDQGQLEEIRRIEEVGFMKIVLFYELRSEGACQLSACYVDGMKVPVVDDPDADRDSRS